MDLSAEEMGAGTAAGGGRLPAANGAVGGDSGEKLQPVRQLLLDSLTYRIQEETRTMHELTSSFIFPGLIPRPE